MTNESATSGRPPAVDRAPSRPNWTSFAPGRRECTNTRTEGGPPAWPPVPEWPAGRPIPQWPRLEAGYSDDLTAGH
jgi:hypothetical protein